METTLTAKHEQREDEADPAVDQQEFQVFHTQDLGQEAAEVGHLRV
jgi:hypothetical protein